MPCTGGRGGDGGEETGVVQREREPLSHRAKCASWNICPVGSGWHG